MPRERLQKLLARAGVASRREAERLVAQGRVTVNGRRAAIGDSADPETDSLAVDGRVVGGAPRGVYLAVHKPAGFLSSARDERGRRSVISLIPDRPARLWPAGRLDADSEGLMVLTNDGDWANRLIHPRYGLVREYAVLLAEPLSRDALARLLTGVDLTDGPARLLSARPSSAPREIEGVAADPHGAWLTVTVGEGRKREVRRILTAVGAEVVRLVRTRLGPLSLARLRPGEWRELTTEEVERLAPRGSAGVPVPHPRLEEFADRPLRIAIDGPSGVGKSTIGRALARRVGATFVDTGLIYRALALAAHEAGMDPGDADGLADLAERLRVEIRPPAPGDNGQTERVEVAGRDVTALLMQPAVDGIVSLVSSHAAVRAAMLDLQRGAAGPGSVVMAGRDIGTVVLPDADLKVFLVGASRVRAERRAAQVGEPQRVNEHQRAIEERDARDTERAASPLRQAEGALVLDTGRLDVEACVRTITHRLAELGVSR